MIPNELSDITYSFTGWFPSEDEDGKGIGIIDQAKVYQGYYPRMNGGFPSGYKDLDYIYKQFKVSSFKERTKI